MARFLVVSLSIAMLGIGAAVASPEARAPRPALVLPLDIEVVGSSLYVADAERHQILRFDLRRGRTSVYAGTGVRGSSGDGGPARRARIGEPTEIVVDRQGSLYFADVNQGRVRRIDKRGIITTVARVASVAGLALHPDGGSLAIAAIDGWVYRLDLPSGSLARVAGNGTQATGGDGGPASQAALNGPHDVTYDAAGNLLVGCYDGVRRIDARDGTIATAFAREATKVVLGPRGTVFLLAGSPTGGTITQVDAGGAVLRVIGTGGLTPHAARVSARRVGFLPSDVELVGATLLVSQTEPVAAVRRLGGGSDTLTTVLR